MLPNFIVIGAAKAGTTSLHHYLRQHPDVFLPADKETNYFWSEAAAHGRRTPRNLAEYERLFAGATGQAAIGEISPQYLNSADAAQRIRAALDDPRLIVSLRNPADRAYSDYLGRTRILRESRPLPEALRPGEPCLEGGFYHPRLTRYYDHFAPERIHVLLYEDFAADAAASVRGLFAFLGVDPEVAVDTRRRHNAAAVPRSPRLNRLLWTAVPALQRLVPHGRRGSGRAAALLERTYRPAPALTPELRLALLERYREDIALTSALIGRDLSRWLG